MQLTPRYGSDPIITLDGPPSAVAAPVIRQRRRLAAVLSSLDDAQWAAPTRCDGWSVRDVVLHLDSTNGFWAYSMTSGLRGEPTEVLASFDPVATPALLVAAEGDVSGTAALERLQRSTEALVELWDSLDDAGWATTAEAPPGHVTISALAHHALWDSWIHERDILLPLGIEQEVVEDEVAAALRYVAALAPAFGVSVATSNQGVLAIAATRPDLSFHVTVDGHAAVREGDAHADLRLEGDAVELLEGLSLRRPLDREIPSEAAWLVAGLATAFDAARS